MKKIFFLVIFSFLFLNAQNLEETQKKNEEKPKEEYKVEKNRNLFLVKISNSNFKKNLSYLKDELTFRGFKIIYELDMAKGNKEIARLLEKTEVLQKGINLGVCKSSFTFEMLEENPNNINYCPISISIYSPKSTNKEDARTTYISYKYYKSFKFGDKIADKINATLEDIILQSLD